MRLRILTYVLLTCASAPLIGQSVTPDALTADEVVTRTIAHDEQRDGIAGGYTGVRQYVLNNQTLGKQARMIVSTTCKQDGAKEFQVLSEQGWASANDSVLRKLLESESNLSRQPVRSSTQLTSENYYFQLASMAQVNGRPAYVIDPTPKRQNEHVFRERIWFDVEDCAAARIEGEPARNPSIWIRSSHFTQEYRKEGRYWFPWLTICANEARVFGKTEVDIHYFDYAPRTAEGGKEMDRGFMEALYVKH